METRINNKFKKQSQRSQLRLRRTNGNIHLLRKLALYMLCSQLRLRRTNGNNSIFAFFSVNQ